MKKKIIKLLKRAMPEKSIIIFFVIVLGVPVIAEIVDGTITLKLLQMNIVAALGFSFIIWIVVFFFAFVCLLIDDR